MRQQAAVLRGQRRPAFARGREPVPVRAGVPVLRLTHRPLGKRDLRVVRRWRRRPAYSVGDRIVGASREFRARAHDEKTSSRSSSKPASSGERSVSLRPNVCATTSAPARGRRSDTVWATGIDQPVLLHAVLRIEGPLVAAIPVGGAGGQDFDYQIGCSPHVVAAAQQVPPFTGHEQQIRLHGRRCRTAPRRRGRSRVSRASVPR